MLANDNTVGLLKNSKRDRPVSNATRRLQLIEATIESIAICGFNKTTLNTVTQIANLSHSVVNFHFKSKDLSLLETMKFLIAEHLNHWHTNLRNASGSAEANLKALIATDFVEQKANPKRLAVWSGHRYASGLDESESDQVPFKRELPGQLVREILPTLRPISHTESMGQTKTLYQGYRYSLYTEKWCWVFSWRSN